MAYGVLQIHRKPPFAAAAAILHMDSPHGAVEFLDKLPLVRSEEARFAGR